MSKAIRVFFTVTVNIAFATTAWPTTAVSIPPPSCNQTCGDVRIPYPFGLKNDVSDDCYLHPGFNLTCNYSFNPPKPFAFNIEVTSINISSGQITILLNVSYDCYYDRMPNHTDYTWWTNLRPSPYSLSYTENVFTAIGCDTLAQFKITDNSFAGCMSGCSSNDSVHDGICSGIGCCQASIPPGVKYIHTSFYKRNSTTSEAYLFNPCNYSFLVQKGNYTFSKSDLTGIDTHRSFPVVLDFSIQNQTCQAAMANSTSYACASNNSKCVDFDNRNGYFCSCSPGYEGNPYLPDGCKDIDECSRSRDVYPCRGDCTNLLGNYSCTCPKGSYSDDPKKSVHFQREIANGCCHSNRYRRWHSNIVAPWSTWLFRSPEKEYQQLKNEKLQQPWWVSSPGSDFKGKEQF